MVIWCKYKPFMRNPNISSYVIFKTIPTIGSNKCILWRVVTTFIKVWAHYISWWVSHILEKTKKRNSHGCHLFLGLFCIPVVVTGNRIHKQRCWQTNFNEGEITPYLTCDYNGFVSAIYTLKAYFQYGIKVSCWRIIQKGSERLVRVGRCIKQVD